MLLHTIELALSVQPERIVAVINDNLAALYQNLKYPKTEFIINPQAHSGMASSLQAGAKVLKHDSNPVLILTIDQICLTKEILDQFIQASQHNPHSHIVSSYAQTIGIPAMIQPDLLAATQQLNGDRGLKPLLIQTAQPLIKLEMPQLAFDIDTPDDLAYAVMQNWIDAS